jgi:ribose-phosphate pyrophosphokinase
VTPLLYALPGNAAFTAQLRAACRADEGELEARHFPDVESLGGRVTNPRGREAALVCTLDRPDGKLVPLLLAAATARELGARSVGLVAPYLPYMRQDRAFEPGECRSAAHVARLLSAHFDWLVTVDPHLHRYRTLDEIYAIPSTAVAAAPLLARWVAAHVERPLVIGPDAESRQWAEAVAAAAGAPWCVLDKVRAGDRRVALRLPDLSRWRRHTPVLADDIISTGATLAEAVRLLRARGFAPPVCVAVHAVFAAGAHDALLTAGAARVVTTNTIAHASNAIDVAAAVAAACQHAAYPPREIPA